MKHKQNLNKVLKQELQVLFHIVMAKFPIPENCSAYVPFPEIYFWSSLSAQLLLNYWTEFYETW
jgi:hypothetical protein